MTKIGIMQPYLFPYIGYFQLINAVDIFVVYDDVQYIKNGWINRNMILSNNDKILFTFSVKKDSMTTKINERYYLMDSIDNQIENFLKTLFQSYHKAPFFSQVYSIIHNIFQNDNLNVSAFNFYSLSKICEYLEIPTKFVLSSSLQRDIGLKGEEAVIEIVKKLNGNCYINAIGGLELYSSLRFKEEGLKLRFIKMKKIQYFQYNLNFFENLSIIDILMFNSKDQIKNLLLEYELI